jgi:Fe-S cluster biogenesis protein NfuA
MSDASTLQPVTIRAEVALADPDSCRFTVSREVHPGGAEFFGSAADAAGSPLPERLFALPGVAHVLVAGNVVSVGKQPTVDWATLKAAIGAAIRSQLQTGLPAVFRAPVQAGAPGRSDADIRRAVEELLDREVNRAIAAHGGRIVLMDVRDGDVYIAMEGGCQGCASSQITLRQGFEVMLRRVVPEAGAVMDTTDHAAGQAPWQRDGGQA